MNWTQQTSRVSHRPCWLQVGSEPLTLACLGDQAGNGGVFCLNVNVFLFVVWEQPKGSFDSLGILRRWSDLLWGWCIHFKVILRVKGDSIVWKDPSFYSSNYCNKHEIRCGFSVYRQDDALFFVCETNKDIITAEMLTITQSHSEVIKTDWVIPRYSALYRTFTNALKRILSIQYEHLSSNTTSGLIWFGIFLFSL